MIQETKLCQNCKGSFTIETKDFVFYEKIKVPTPTFCPQCRFERRLMFRNERVFYKRQCALCRKNIIALFAPEKPYTVYCQPCWWSDKWNAMQYGMSCDPNRNFFEQFRELQTKVPFMSLINGYTQLVNSEYVNHTDRSKNCYLIFNCDYCENVLYGKEVAYGKDSMDVIMLRESELCYRTINCGKCYRVFFSEDCTNCFDVYFSKELVGCGNCFGCVNLRNKNYHIFNKPCSKEEYERKMQEYNFHSFSGLEKIQEEARAFWRKFPHKFMHGMRNVNVSGDYVYESKNAQHMYQVRFVENGKFSQLLTLAPVKDVYDFTEWGNGAELVYDSITVGEGARSIKFCYGSWANVLENEYCMFAVSSSHCFGCVNIRKKEYCILNKQYSRGGYETLRERIIHDMNDRPYTDTKGRVWRYGEFFPYDLSLFAWNESTAVQYWNRAKDEVLAAGWQWREPTPNQYQITLTAENIPDDIRDVNDSILNEIIGCAKCGKACRLIKAELDLLKRLNFPISRECSDCRFRDGMSRVNPPWLWERTCARCGAQISTSYAPERPEIIYCEQCYSTEVV